MAEKRTVQKRASKKKNGNGGKVQAGAGIKGAREPLSPANRARWESMAKDQGRLKQELEDLGQIREKTPRERRKWEAMAQEEGRLRMQMEDLERARPRKEVKHRLGRRKKLQ